MPISAFGFSGKWKKTKIGLQLTPFWPELRCSWECNLLEIIDSNLIQENRPKNAWVIVKDAKGVNKKFRPCPRRMVSRRNSGHFLILF